jgi:hypothetical protein
MTTNTSVESKQTREDMMTLMREEVHPVEERKSVFDVE